MIQRYSRPEISAIWSEDFKYNTWLQIEILACEKRAERGEVPLADLAEIKSKANFEINRILEIEETTNHDVIAFLTNVAEYVGPASRHIHYGMTSSDVLDTALSYQMKAAGEILLQDLYMLKESLWKRAAEHKNTLCIGRTHGIHAEPITMGLKFALWYEETRRNIYRLEQAVKNISFGKISGAVGTFDHLEPDVEDYVCRGLGLEPAPISTQVLQRDRHAEYISVLAIIGGTLEKIATEIRHLQKTEVLEAEEYFAKGQKGSSAMPHKRNPITCERIAGMARILRGNATAAFENIALWHERDITHSSVERVIIPDSTILLDYMLAKTISLIDNLLLYPENMMKNFNKTRGLVFSQRVLLRLVEKGLTREAAYKAVQTAAMTVWKDESKNMKDELLADDSVTKFVSKEEIDDIFNPANLLKNLDKIFERTIYS
ncbi:MAG: adenylosuccinate lyase [Ignavibacteriaceae bacterium]|nr:adenylosuccinate lyase [Ignavibacteriaceae bacterium]